MDPRADQLRILGLMAAHESAIGDLYRACATTFPSHKDFFDSLAGQEVDHARAITAFCDKVLTRQARVDVDRFSDHLLMPSLDHVKQLTNQLLRDRPPLAEVLAHALELEEHLIEKSFFDAFEGDSPELTDLLKKLETETTEHREKVRHALQTEEGGAAPS